MTTTTGPETAAEPVSAHAGDWNREQQRKAALYGTCRTCGAPRDTAISDLEPGVHLAEFVCLNGHRGAGV